MLNKKIIILSIFLVSLLAISAVSAAENSTEDITSINTGINAINLNDNFNEINAANNNGICSLEDHDDDFVDIKSNGLVENFSSSSHEITLKDSYGTFDELNQLINTTSSGIVTLDKDYEYTPHSKESVVILNNIIIEGNNKIIKSIIFQKNFKIYANNLKINNVNFVRDNFETMTYDSKQVYNATFTNCSFSKIFLDSLVRTKNTTVSFFNCKFDHSFIGDAYRNHVHYYGCTFLQTSSDGSSYLNCSFKWSGALLNEGIISGCHFDNSSFSSYVNVTVFNNTFKDLIRYYPGGLPGEPTLHPTGYRILSGTARIINCNFVNNLGDNGGALSISGNTYISNCSFINNVGDDGGALSISGNTYISNCSFINNTAIYHGGAIYSLNDTIVKISNCIFINNSAKDGGAIYEDNTRTEVSDSQFINNVAHNNGGSLFMTTEGNYLFSLIFDGNLASNGGAIYCNGTGIVIDESSYYKNRALKNGGAIYVRGNGGLITSSIFNNNTAINGAGIYWEGSNGLIKDSILIQNDLNSMIYSDKYVDANYNWWGNMADNYNQKPNVQPNINVKNWLFLNITTGNMLLNVGDISTIYCDLTHFTTSNGIISKYYAFDLPNIILNAEFDNGALNSINLIEGLGEINYVATSVPCGFVTIKYNNIQKIINFTIGKENTKILSKLVNTVYNGEKYLIAILKDNKDNILRNVKLTIVLNGKSYTSNTDKNGQVKLSTNGLVPKTYIAKIIFNGNNNYEKSSVSVDITVKKATPKLTAKAKTFKKSLKTKKYSIILKTNQNKVMKNTKLTLKVNGKTYSATTNSKGQATFKITKLTKKGTFKATITYKGNAYYNKVTKKVNIKCK